MAVSVTKHIKARKKVNQAREKKFPLDFRYNAILVKLLFKHITEHYFLFRYSVPFITTC